MLAKREKLKLTVVPEQLRDSFIRDVEKSYFEIAMKNPVQLPTDHHIFGCVLSYLHKTARLEIFEDQHYFSNPYPADELSEFKDANEDDFINDIMAVLNFHNLSYDSFLLDKYINLPVGRVW
jgi:hypothetical protein